MTAPIVPTRTTSRIEVLDLARAVALLAMASYHFAWDLEFFGYLDPGTTAFGAWKAYARCIASTFLVLAGISLVLAQARGIRWRPFLVRFGMVGGAALAITAVTFAAMRAEFIFFGILHEIALASLLGLAFLRLPALVTALCAAAVIALPFYLRLPVFDHPALWWVGLGTINPRSNDYVPIFPWFGAVLAGIALAKLAIASGLRDRLAAIGLPRWTRVAQAAGRHSLAFYLIHQPLLFGTVWLFSQIYPAPVRPPDVTLQQQWQASCAAVRMQDYCKAYSVCMVESLRESGDLERFLMQSRDTALDARLKDMAAICADEAEFGIADPGQAPATEPAR